MEFSKIAHPLTRIEIGSQMSTIKMKKIIFFRLFACHEPPSNPSAGCRMFPAAPGLRRNNLK